MSPRLSRRVRVLLCGVPLAVAGCAGLSESPAPVLVGTEWRVGQMGGRDVPASVEITLAFPEAGRVTGKAACNRYFGTYTQARQSIGFAQMGATRMACAGLAAELETTYLKALQTASRFEIRGSEMVLHLGGPQPPLRLQRTR